MIQYNGKCLEVNHFPDGTLLLKETAEKSSAPALRRLIAKLRENRT